MKKIVLSLVLVMSIIFAFASCSSSQNTSGNVDFSNTTEFNLPSESYTAPTETESITEATSTTEISYHSEYVITSFSAIQGAVIYDYTYDSNGNLQTCKYYKKCEACGDVNNMICYASGDHTSTYHCRKCDNNQNVKIKAIKTLVQIPD